MHPCTVKFITVDYTDFGPYLLFHSLLAYCCSTAHIQGVLDRTHRTQKHCSVIRGCGIYRRRQGLVASTASYNISTFMNTIKMEDSHRARLHVPIRGLARALLYFPVFSLPPPHSATHNYV
jgi:hypothetical protein